MVVKINTPFKVTNQNWDWIWGVWLVSYDEVEKRFSLMEKNLKLMEIDPLVYNDNESFDYLDEDDNDYSCFSATIEFKKVLSNIFINIPIFAFADTPFKILVAMKSCDVTLTKANKECILEMLDNFIVSVNNFEMIMKKHNIKKKIKEMEKDFK